MCREEDLIYQDADGKVFTREKYMVFETFGSFIADEYFFPVESIIKTGYAVQVISILVNPPCLVSTRSPEGRHSAPTATTTTGHPIIGNNPTDNIGAQSVCA